MRSELQTTLAGAARSFRVPLARPAESGKALMQMWTYNAAIRRSTTRPPNESLQMFFGTRIGILTLRQIFAQSIC